MAATCSILGGGNAAWHFCRLLFGSGYKIDDLYIRNEANDDDFAQFGAIKKVRTLQDISQSSDLYFFCVSDDAIKSLVESFPFKPSENQICLHTSGSLPVTIFNSFFSRYGCMWPLQTLKKGIVPIHHDFPFILTASDPETESRLRDITISFSHTCIPATDYQRAALHLAAVLTGNFMNHLLTSGFDYCQSQQIDFSSLKSLILETVTKSLNSPDPSQNQTGPASRHDVKTVERHLEMLSDHSQLRKMYSVLSESIMAKHPLK